jgi:hypothetical protein
MQLTLEHDIEELVATEVREGRFESPEALMAEAVRQFLVAKKYGIEEANRLAVLREELWRANADECTEYDTDTLPSLFKETREEALRRLGRKNHGS